MWPLEGVVVVQEVARQESRVEHVAAAVTEVGDRVQMLLETSAHVRKALTQARQKASRARSKADSAKRAAVEIEASHRSHEAQLKVWEIFSMVASITYDFPMLNKIFGEYARLASRFASMPHRRNSCSAQVR